MDTLIVIFIYLFVCFIFFSGRGGIASIGVVWCDKAFCRPV